MERLSRQRIATVRCEYRSSDEARILRKEKSYAPADLVCRGASTQRGHSTCLLELFHRSARRDDERGLDKAGAYRIHSARRQPRHHVRQHDVEAHRIPCLPYSKAALLVKPMTACLEATATLSLHSGDDPARAPAPSPHRKQDLQLCTK
jgi:hypothetical protein